MLLCCVLIKMKIQLYALTISFVLTLSALTAFGNLPLSSAQQQNTTQSSGPSSVTIIIPSRASIANEVQEYYQPEVTQAPNGSIVTWSNRDSTLHTATAGNPINGPSGQFDTGMITPGGFGSAMINGEGRVLYYCTLHPFMLGVIEVTSAEAPAGGNVTSGGNATDGTAGNATGMQPTDNATSVNATDLSIEPFTAQGQIASLTVPVSQAANTTLASDTGENKSYVLAGSWNLDVQSSNATQFEANFTMVHTDGTGRHMHTIGSFEPVSTMQQNASIFITGSSDITVNGTTQWSQVWVTLIIENNSTLTIGVNTEATENHFRGQPIFGIVESMRDESGNETSAAGE